MKLIIGNWCFCPRLITSLLALVFFGLFISLGFWQLDRADYKRTLYSDFENRQSGQAIDLNHDNTKLSNKEEIIWRHVNATGEFLEQYQILLDNQVELGQAGYYVYTPFKLEQSEHVVLINRGWLSAGNDRTASPEIIMTNGFVNIKGVAKEEPKTGLLLKEMPPEQMNKGIYRVQRLNIDEVAELTKTKLLPYIVRLEPGSEHGYRRQWRLPGSGVSIHNGYAFQWFAFATALLIIYLVLNIKNIQRMGQSV
ncbi:MAG: SURF1 family protein [Gammaproteobacteria bacterium]|nr:MAG: SURF1 family protein [Gammaproteobacteria bacterium]